MFQFLPEKRTNILLAHRICAYQAETLSWTWYEHACTCITFFHISPQSPNLSHSLVPACQSTWTSNLRWLKTWTSIKFLMNIKFPAQCPKLHARNKFLTWLPWILSPSVKLKQKYTWCKVVHFGNRTPNDEETMQVKHMIRLSYRKRCSLGHRQRTRSNSNLNVQLRSCGTWKCRTQFVSNVQAASCKLMCQLKWLEHFVPRLNPYRPRDYPSIASKIPHGAKEVDRIPSDSNINLTHGHGHLLLFKQANTLQSRHFRLSWRFFFDDAPRIGIDLPSWLVRFFLFRHRPIFFSARSLAKVFRRSLHYRATMRNWWRWPCSWSFFFSSEVVGWLVGAFMGRKDLMWELLFLFKRRYVLLLWAVSIN